MLVTASRRNFKIKSQILPGHKVSTIQSHQEQAKQAVMRKHQSTTCRRTSTMRCVGATPKQRFDTKSCYFSWHESMLGSVFKKGDCWEVKKQKGGRPKHLSARQRALCDHAH